MVLRRKLKSTLVVLARKAKWLGFYASVSSMQIFLTIRVVQGQPWCPVPSWDLKTNVPPASSQGRADSLPGKVGRDPFPMVSHFHTRLAALRPLQPLGSSCQLTVMRAGKRTIGKTEWTCYIFPFSSLLSDIVVVHAFTNMNWASPLCQRLHWAQSIAENDTDMLPF